MPEPNYYEILGVKRDATYEEIRSKYLELAKKYHPDANTTIAPIAEEEMRKINEAYQTLSDQEKRAAYDKRTGGTSLAIKRMSSIAKAADSFLSNPAVARRANSIAENLSLRSQDMNIGKVLPSQPQEPQTKAKSNKCPPHDVFVTKSGTMVCKNCGTEWAKKGR